MNNLGALPSPSSPARHGEAPPRAPRIAWLDGARVDLPFYIGGALVGWAALIAHAVFHVPAVLLYVAWILVFDGPHLWATISRTYFDREERRNRASLLVGATAWAALPIATLAWGHLTGQRLPWALFLAFVQLWAYWHVVRQHYGFLVLYQRKAGEPAGTANRIDYYAFYIVMLAPFASFGLRHPAARHDLGFPVEISAIERGINYGLLALTAAALLVYVAKEIQRSRSGQRVNVAKNLFLAACVPLHLVTLLHPTWSVSIELVAVSVIVTTFHNVQYDAIVWRYGQRRYRSPDAAQRFGFAARLFSNPIAWYVVGLALTIALRSATWSIDGRFWPFTPPSRPLPGPFTAVEYVNAWWWIVAMHHYFLDQRIWRVSRDAGLRAQLGLNAA